MHIYYNIYILLYPYMYYIMSPPICSRFASDHGFPIGISGVLFLFHAPLKQWRASDLRVLE